MIKFSGEFGKCYFTGHTTLSALSISEASENVRETLPRSSTDVEIVVVVETLESSNVSKDYSILPDRVY